MKIGILRETKLPVDQRTPLTPRQVKELSEIYRQHEFVVQRSSIRAFKDEEYSDLGIPVVDDMISCDVLVGVKEVDEKNLIPEKTYLFFSHTAKMQAHNQHLLQEASKKKITLIDYEYLTVSNIRVVAFGLWAGIVGAYKAMLGMGLQTKDFELKSADDCIDLRDMNLELQRLEWKRPVKIVVTGEGRVASGAVEILEAAGIRKIPPKSYLKENYSQPVYCQTGPQHYTKHKEGKDFNFDEFVASPQNFESSFYPYAAVSDVFIACHFWDPDSPVFFTKDQMKKEDFKIRFIADISCDIGGPIPTTLRASTLENPFYGINRANGDETKPFIPDVITVMAVDNLPGGLPRDASEDFGKGLIKWVFPELLKDQPGDIIRRATILAKGELTDSFSYLEDFLQGNYTASN